MTQENIITAGVLVIGDEILSGRTKDSNSGYIADYLTMHGIDLKEIRVVADETDAIISAVIALSEKYTHVFSTGGIGPTHDDITADAIAAAFNVDIDYNEEAIAMIKAHLGSNAPLNAARMRMARIPFGASLIKNGASAPPGFKIKNVHVLAGVPAVMKSMLEQISSTLPKGTLIHNLTLPFSFGEGLIAEDLGKIQKNYDTVSIGSYPTIQDGRFVTSIVLRSRDKNALQKAGDEVTDLIKKLENR